MLMSNPRSYISHIPLATSFSGTRCGPLSLSTHYTQDWDHRRWKIHSIHRLQVIKSLNARLFLQIENKRHLCVIVHDIFWCHQRGISWDSHVDHTQSWYRAHTCMRVLANDTASVRRPTQYLWARARVRPIISLTMKERRNGGSRRDFFFFFFSRRLSVWLHVMLLNATRL